MTITHKGSRRPKLLLMRAMFWLSPKRRLHGIHTAIWFLASSDERLTAFTKIEAALEVIGEHAPVRFAQLCRDVKRILVFGDPTVLGRHIRHLAMIELYFDYTLAADTSSAQLASTIVHEAQHARLCRLGFGYEEPIRGRIERLCFMAERNFAHRLPDGGEIAERAEQFMEAEADLYFSKRALRQAKLKALRELGCPDWLVRVAAWIGERRAT